MISAINGDEVTCMETSKNETYSLEVCYKRHILPWGFLSMGLIFMAMLMIQNLGIHNKPTKNPDIEKVHLEKSAKQDVCINVEENVINATQRNLHSNISVYIFFTSLLIDGILEGLALGAASTDKKLISLIISIHPTKIFEGFALGTWIQSSIENPHVFLLLYYTTAPIAACISMLLIDGVEEGSVVEVVVNGLVGGSLLFVVFIEIIPNEFKQGNWKKTLFVVGGFGVMAVIGFLVHQ